MTLSSSIQHLIFIEKKGFVQLENTIILLKYLCSEVIAQGNMYTSSILYPFFYLDFVILLLSFF
jgi:hypothetical protein